MLSTKSKSTRSSSSRTRAPIKGGVVLDLVPEVVVVDDVAFDIVVNGVVLDFDSMPESPMRGSPK